MHIVMVADQYPPIVGGTERQAEKLSQALVRRGHQVTVLTGRWRRSMAPREVVEGVEVRRVSTLCSMGGIPGLRKYGQDLFHRSLRPELRQLLPKADVVHAHFLAGGAAVAIEMAAPLGVPVMVKETSSGPNNSFHRLGKLRHGTRLQGFFLENLRHVAVLNQDARREYEALAFRDLQVHATVNGVSLDPGHPSWSPTPNQDILFLGRLQAVKGASDLLEAYARVASAMEGWTLRICGDGPEMASLRKRAAALGVEAQVDFAGYTRSPLEELSSCGLLALPSRAEGMSNTLLEAMATGTPTVATAVGSNPEMLDGEAGWLVPPEDSRALSETLLSATRSDEERARRGRRARERAEQVYSMDVVAASFEELYHRLRGGGGS